MTSGHTPEITEKIQALINRSERSLSDVFYGFNNVEESTLKRILDAFHNNNIGQRHFAPTTGYGYDDTGRDALDRVFASALESEAALVRPHIVSGTHAAFLTLSGTLSSGDIMLSVTGKPYDTLEKAIGLDCAQPGSLTAMGVRYEELSLAENGKIDIDALKKRLENSAAPKAVYIQRSRGYAWRDSLLPQDMAATIDLAHNAGSIVIIDNCYGEFTQPHEPCYYGGDLQFGSLIKNPGGGIAPTGGYIAGRASLVERIAERLTVPGIGGEVGSYAASYQPFFQGLFLAPGVTAASLKSAALFADVFSRVGFDVLPAADSPRSDIVESIRLRSADGLKAFCRGIQAAAPVDSSAVPEPWDMPGYSHQVIMAAGSFIQGASIELSADGPMIPPYTAYVQGALSYQHGRLGVLYALEALVMDGIIRVSDIMG